MIIISGLDEVKPLLQGKEIDDLWPNRVVVLGNFDGVHLGHREILQDTVKTAHDFSGTSIGLTFWPHPSKILAPKTAPNLIQTLPQRQAAMAALGLQVLVVEKFDKAFSQIEYDDFFEEHLHRILKPKALRVGARFAFGHQRKGHADNLSRLCQKQGIDFRVLPEFRWQGEEVSSSRIRQLLSQGNLDQANRILGRAYEIQGTVVGGEKRGQKIGFPTANINMENELLLPRGVYACRAQLPGKTSALDSLKGVANLGIRPTFSAGENSEIPEVLEVHLFDFTREIYGSQISLEIVGFLRPEKKFTNPGELKRQIQQDCLEAKKLLT